MRLWNEMTMIVLAKIDRTRLYVGLRQTGIALLQVLLLTVMISLLAIRFTQTARDQMASAVQFDHRVRAELGAYSVFNEIIFSQLSETVVQRSDEQSNSAELLFGNEDLNFYGEPFLWGEGIEVVLQDLNGLLPQMFPDHFLWERLLLRKSVPQADVDAYLGLWGDLQDPDIESWMAGEVEPIRLSGGMIYPNGFAQNSLILERVFDDRPELTADLLSFSDVDAPFETNFLHSPELLLDSLFDASMAGGIKALRHKNSVANPGMLEKILPNDLPLDFLNGYRSNLLKVEIFVELEDSSWRDKRTVRLQASSKPPFEIVLND